ncbi:MAG: hypothetical protein KIT58_16645, partial [Planctomycetota bacterium]|nr:hypothetical protein [Planctomycetota bacterium]
WELQDRERYEDAVKVLEGFPAALRGGKGYHDVKEKLAEYSRFAGYKRKLEGAIAAGGGSEELRSLVGRVESGRMERDLLKLPCTDRFKDDARRVLGSSVYDEIAMKAIDLPPEVTVPDDEE